MMMSGTPMLLLVTVFLQYLLWSVKADVYLHNPRGSNDRLNGAGVNRANARRVFDSQNNAKGGYNAGEKTEKKSTDWYEMEYIMSGLEAAAPGKSGRSTVSIEWTNQHGCGDGDLNCNLVIQYNCQPASIHGGDKRLQMRDGTRVATPRYSKRDFKSKREKDNQEKAQNQVQNVLNESWEWYDKCNKRTRNKGLFTADQRLRGDKSRFTRQNRNGNQHGYECPEERDYYPYFHPNPWIDVAVLATNKSLCDYYREESFNVKPKGECMERYADGTWKHASVHNNAKECVGGGGKWTEFSQFLHILSQHKTEAACKAASTAKVPLIWAIPHRSDDLDRMNKDPSKWYKCLARPHPPDCKEAPHSRSNHLGNGEGVKALTYDWVLPYIPQDSAKPEDYFRCVLRIRYNISTNDYDQLNTFSESNQQKPINNLITNQSPIENDPVVNVGQDEIPLQLAINTAQFGRTFQDRSHVFRLFPRKNNIKDLAIYNLNVRGKRGNIVQAYPAVEYDFSPKRLSIKNDDAVHIQWTGSNSNPNGNDGEGRRGSDRSNVVVMEQASLSYPLTSLTPSMFANAEVIDWRKEDEKTRTAEDLTVSMATAGQYATKQDFLNVYNSGKLPTNPRDRKYKQYAQLDYYPPSNPGQLMKFKKGTYLFMCSRNNNFSNRSQKSRLSVT